MHSMHLVVLALKTLSWTQKELAQFLDVSPTQISKWKKGEYMSDDMEKRIRQKINLGDLSPELVSLVGGIDNAVKWDKVIKFIADLEKENADTGYRAIPLEENTEFLSSQIMQIFVEMDIEIPAQFPTELELNYDEDDEDSYEEFACAIEDNNYTKIILAIFSSLNDVYGFYTAYIEDFIFDEKLDLYDTEAANIEPCLIFLAASKIDIDITFARNFNLFKYKINQKYVQWINLVKEQAFRAGIPLRAELLDIVYKSHGEVGHEAEAESLGINENKLHPDIYMNELLVGMRLIHQVLPKIMAKLEITDFMVNDSDLRV
ncbi:MAG: helix-turn-helix transcriptional regulator [Providencia heimbachae]|nr:helix-turn-helix transcriptional regulator [Providencia heimbachae]